MPERKLCMDGEENWRAGRKMEEAHLRTSAMRSRLSVRSICMTSRKEQGITISQLVPKLAFRRRRLEERPCLPHNAIRDNMSVTNQARWQQAETSR